MPRGNKIAIVHFNPVEGYPPTVNFIKFLSGRKQDWDILVITTGSSRGNASLENGRVKIRIPIEWKNRFPRWKRAWGYLMFHLRTLFWLLKFRPDSVLYYETLSSFAPCMLKRIIRPSVSLFIHYHEYNSPEDYRIGMLISRWMHFLEKKIYSGARWISHTNEKRMELFLKDIGMPGLTNTHIMPNYPPASWRKIASGIPRNPDPRIGFVYVGALSLHTMFTEEMAKFVASRPGSCYWDIYSANHDQNAIDLLKMLSADNIRFKGRIEYDELPAVLTGYDIGIILYKGTTSNYRYNAPNKFFEYRVCGLNVWYPVQMEGLRAYENPESRPWIRGVDFADLNIPEVQTYHRDSGSLLPEYSCEKVYELLLKELETIKMK